MKKLYIPAALALALSLILVTTQALASSAGAVSFRKTPGPPPTRSADATSAEPVPMGPKHAPGPQNVPGSAATAHAGMHGKPQIYRGTLTVVSASNLTLKLADGSSVTISITPDTRIHVPGPKGSGDTLLVGMQAVVMAFTDQNSNLVARAVMVIPGRPTLVHRVGKVTAYAAGASITIQATDGNSYSFTLTADTKILPAAKAASLTVGSLVTIIAPRDPSSLGWTATGIVVHPSSP